MAKTTSLKKSAASQPAELENKLKRALADYDNLEKRIEREKKDFLLFFSAQLIRKILVVMDDLERCQNHLGNDGLSLIIQKFQQLLKEEGVVEIQAVGQEFDPELMEAIETVDGPKGKVVEVSLKGYLLNGKVLRPAKVTVGGSTENRKEK